MDIVRCPRCLLNMNAGSSPPGSQVSCPQCREPFIIPYPARHGELIVGTAQPQYLPSLPPPPPTAQQPVIIVQTTPEAPRVRHRDRFSASFSSVSGGLIAFLLLMIVLPCGGMWMLGTWSQANYERNEEAVRSRLIKAARPYLTRNGLVGSIAKDSRVRRDANKAHLLGTARDRDGKLHEFFISFRYAEFDESIQLDFSSLFIDNEIADFDTQAAPVRNRRDDRST